ncbi:MAG: RNA polymerase sigma factor RpoH [Methylococcales bacterium]|jgi:RNA polymerase sigma-32 factor|nr:RNA polymerase sigma factor RpoH [Methylococcales bacterium]
MNSLALSQPIGSIDAYIASIQKVPVLTREQEQTYADKLFHFGDLEAAQALVMHNLRFVVKIAHGYKGYGLALQDLIQEGNVGLMKAVKRFNPEAGVRLVSFAVHWIRSEIHEFVIKNWRIAKVATTKQQRKLFFNLRKNKKRLGWFSQEEVNAVAEDLGVTPKNVMEMEARMSNYDVSFDAPDNDDDENNYSPSNYLTNQSVSPEKALEVQDNEAQQHNRLKAALEGLDARSLRIIQARWLAEEKKATLHDLAAELGVSAERVRQLEKKAMNQMKSALND